MGGRLSPCIQSLADSRSFHQSTQLWQGGNQLMPARKAAHGSAFNRRTPAGETARKRLRLLRDRLHRDKWHPLSRRYQQHRGIPGNLGRMKNQALYARFIAWRLPPLIWQMGTIPLIEFPRGPRLLGTRVVLRMQVPGSPSSNPGKQQHHQKCGHMPHDSIVAASCLNASILHQAPAYTLSSDKNPRFCTFAPFPTPKTMRIPTRNYGTLHPQFLS